MQYVNIKSFPNDWIIIVNYIIQHYYGNKMYIIKHDQLQ